MTLITFQDGKPVLRDGKVGTETACCCGRCPRCIRNGEWVCQYTTEESCEECVRTYECYEVLQTKCDGTCPEGASPSGQQPTLEITGEFGTCSNGATASASLTVGCGVIVSATVTSAGSGFALIGRSEPTVTATVNGTGSGAELAVTLEQYQDECGRDYWRVESVAATAAGSGYSQSDPVLFTVTTGDTDFELASGWVDVDNDGAVVGVYVLDPGWYYREDASAPAYIANISINVVGGGGGTGADIAATIDSTAGSPTFGQITALTVNGGGSGYVSLCERTRPVDGCDDCPPRQQPEYSECGVATETGACGDWQGGFPCDEPCHECDAVGVPTSECPNFQRPCGEVFPSAPYNCCEINGERRCKPWACYPGATITLQFRKKVGCVASGNDPNNILGFVNEGEEFEVAISGGSIYSCADVAQLSSAPCQTEWTLSTGCSVSDLTCDTSVAPICQSCYEFLGWSSCRNDCNGNCE